MNTSLRRTILALTLAPVFLAGSSEPASAEEALGFSPRDQLALVKDAARAWEPDAFLVYLENDEQLELHGTSVRWGYLFYSPATDQARGYSVRGGEIVAASTLEFKFQAPPLPDSWIDAGVALDAANAEAGTEYCLEHGGEPSTLFLMRALDESEPDLTTWTVVYSAPNTPSLFVVVDAFEGKVRETWRG
jgi:hypothetical protein